MLRSASSANLRFPNGCCQVLEIHLARREIPPKLLNSIILPVREFSGKKHCSIDRNPPMLRILGSGARAGEKTNAVRSSLLNLSDARSTTHAPDKLG